MYAVTRYIIAVIVSIDDDGSYRDHGANYAIKWAGVSFIPYQLYISNDIPKIGERQVYSS